MAPEDIIREIPWVEKYRPTSLSEVASQTLTIESLNEFVKKQTLPHCIFTGPAGTGKTSAALALINDLIGKANLTQDVILERNASDEARMEDLDDIKNFVFHTGINENVRFKFVIMDEADNINKDVQSAFRRIIEMAPANVKFFFLCNYVEKIIDPILSRCAVFRFYPLPKEEFFKQLKFIAKKENVPLTNEMADAIFYITQGDMRQSINLFQMSVALILDEEGKIDENKINGDLIYEISGFIPPKKFEKFYLGCSKGEFKKIASAIKGLRGVSSRGMLRQFLTKIIDTIQQHPLQEQLINRLAEYDYRLTLEADPTIQIDAFLADLTRALIPR
jgi:replication factor C small subunit